MSFQESIDTWKKLGDLDPLWAILSDPQKEGGKWDPGEFFASGKREIDEIMARIKVMDLTPAAGTALDFGCGVGRLTQPLAGYFREVHGVDAADTMIERARQFDRSNGNCRYHVNTRSDLSLFSDDTFDFIYSRIVLQHIPPDAARKYVAEFVRTLKPGGLLVFQLPSKLADTHRHAHPCRADISGEPPLGNVEPGERIRMRIKVANTSGMTWPFKSEATAGCFRLGNHWLGKDGSMKVMDDARAAIPGDVAPGQSVELVLDVKAPLRAGDYQLEIDMVQEGFCWFKDYGSPTMRQPVRVGSAWQVTATALIDRLNVLVRAIGSRITRLIRKPPRKPAFSMNAVPKDDVLGILRSAGGKVMAVEDDFSAGSAWLSYMYFVSKEKGDRVPR